MAGTNSIGCCNNFRAVVVNAVAAVTKSPKISPINLGLKKTDGIVPFINRIRGFLAIRFKAV